MKTHHLQHTTTSVTSHNLINSITEMQDWQDNHGNSRHSKQWLTIYQWQQGTGCRLDEPEACSWTNLSTRSGPCIMHQVCVKHHKPWFNNSPSITWKPPLANNCVVGIWKELFNWAEEWRGSVLDPSYVPWLQEWSHLDSFSKLCHKKILPWNLKWTHLTLLHFGLESTTFYNNMQANVAHDNNLHNTWFKPRYHIAWQRSSINNSCVF